MNMSYSIKAGLYTISKVYSPCKKCLVRPACFQHAECTKWLKFVNIFDTIICTLYLTWMVCSICLSIVGLSNYFIFKVNELKVYIFTTRTWFLPFDVLFILFYLNAFWVKIKKKDLARWRN
jgi:hypothetical protein